MQDAAQFVLGVDLDVGDPARVRIAGDPAMAADEAAGPVVANSGLVLLSSFDSLVMLSGSTCNTSV